MDTAIHFVLSGPCDLSPFLRQRERYAFRSPPAGNNVEVFSIDCSVNFGVESKVYFKALGWLLSFIGAAVVPGVSLFVVSVVWRVTYRETALTVALHRWAGQELRGLAQGLLAPLPGEGVAWLAVPAPPPAQGDSSTTARGDRPASESNSKDDLVIFGQQSRLSASSVAQGEANPRRQPTSNSASPSQQVWLPQLQGLKAAIHRLEAALDSRFVLQPHASPGAVEGRAPGAPSSSPSGTSADKPAAPAPLPAGGGPVLSERSCSTLVLSLSDWLLEREMAARCGGHLWQPDKPRSEEELVAASFDYFMLCFACIAFIIWVPAATAILQLFSCIRIDPYPDLSPIPSPYNGRWLLVDTAQKCFEGAHLRYALGVGIPGARPCY